MRDTLCSLFQEVSRKVIWNNKQTQRQKQVFFKGPLPPYRALNAVLLSAFIQSGSYGSVSHSLGNNSTTALLRSEKNLKKYNQANE